jgi:ubiquinone/menaquinone biosynthesis C-methylase UbiE
VHAKLNIKEADAILQELWDKDVKPWDEHWVPVFRRFARDLVTDAHVSTGQVVLDIGTGTGVAAMEAVKRTKSKGMVLGIDRSEPMLEVARVKAASVKNLSFVMMNSEHMTFPDEYFDAATSNCGISYAAFHETVAEIFRVLRRGGSFTFNDWHLIDVPAHRTFGEILRQHRTGHPSKKLRTSRTAIATMEHVGNKYSDPRVQAQELEGVGFRSMQVSQRNYRILLPSLTEYLDMRLEREALKRELSELSKVQRTAFVGGLRAGLRHFVRKSRFVMEWKVTFTNVRKPR